MSSRRLLVIVEESTLDVETIRQHVETFRLMRSFEVKVIHIGRITEEVLASADVLLWHYCVRLAFPQSIPRGKLEIFEKSTKPKIIFLQDEYENTNQTRQLLETISPLMVFTCIPNHAIESIYPKDTYPSTTFVNTLTGFVPEIDASVIQLPDFSNRAVDIGYRGRTLGKHYGRLGYEKWQIGNGFVHSMTHKHNFVLDISSDESDRIYGDNWFQFLGNCKSVLATESGSNIFDFEGELRELDRKNPYMSYFEFEEKFLLNLEKDFMGQISPRIFEAIAMKCLLILFPGNYSNVLVKNRHYLELKKDFSNVDEILEVITDAKAASEFIDNAFLDIALNPEYSQLGYAYKVEREILNCLNKAPLKMDKLSNTLNFPFKVDKWLSTEFLDKSSNAKQILESSHSWQNHKRLKFLKNLVSKYAFQSRYYNSFRWVWRHLPARIRYLFVRHILK